jgi:hypothetical protein
MEMIVADRRLQPFVVKETIKPGIELHSMARDLSIEGMVLDTPPELLENSRYLWLEFGLQDKDDRVKALAEITEKDHFGVKVRFKHMFPDHKRKLAIFLDREALN